MDRLWRWWERIRGIVLRDRVEREVEAEMRHHLEMEIRERTRAGMNPAEARRAALRAFGGVDRWREEVREVRWGVRLDRLGQDVRYAARTLRRSPTFTVVALLTLALGVGASTAVFGVVHATLLHPLPYPDPDRIVRIRTSWQGQPEGGLSPAEYFDHRDGLGHAFEAAGAYAFGTLTLTGVGDPEALRTAFVSASALAALGVEPLRGRWFTDQEDRTDRPVVLVTHGLWEGVLGGDRDALGRTLTLNERPREVVGILPPHFRLPEDLMGDGRAQALVPLGLDRGSVPNRGSHYLRGVARLAPGVTPQAGARALEESGRWMVETFPDAYPPDMGFRVTALPLADDVVGDVRPLLLVFAGAVAVLLLIGVGNVAGLLLARADSRQAELSLRTALGAGRGRLAAQLLTESLLLAVLGGALGVGVAALGTDLLLILRPEGLPRLEEAGLHPPVLAFALAVACGSGLLFGLLPALQLPGGRLARSLREGGHGGGGRPGGPGLRRLLVTGELALALVLLAGASLLGRTFLHLQAVDPGYRTEGVLTGRVSLPAARYPSAGEVVTFFRDLQERLGLLPGVEAAGGVTNLPLAAGIGDLNFQIEGRPVPEGAVSPRADWQAVTPGYLEATGIPLLRGRGIRPSDRDDVPGVVVINETLARLHWPGRDALGRRFLLGGGAGPGWVEVVGVAGDVRHEALDSDEPRPQMYLAHAQFRFWDSGAPVRTLTLAVRSPLPAAEVAPRIRSVVAEADPSLPLSEVRTMAAVREGAVARPRMALVLVGAFSLFALLLAAVGVYGVLAYAVGRRLREIGVRMALGARAPSVTWMVMRQGLGMAGVGLALGGAAALLLTRTLGSLLYGVPPWDPASLAAGAAVLAAAALAASLGPALRAGRSDPARLLRGE